MLEEALYGFLKEDATLATMLSGVVRSRIYPLFVPQKNPGGEQQFPALVYTITGDNRGKGYCGTDQVVENIVVFDSYAITMKAARLLSNALRDALLDYRGLMVDVVVKDVSLRNSLTLSDMEPGLFRVSDTFSIWYEQE